LCRELGLGRAETEVIVRAARVHDIGKLGMSSAIISEARPLTPEERLEMQRHPAIGANIVARFADFRAGTAIVLHHHERWDGAGYPAKLAGTQIPFGARVVAVCDSFDAMTSDRPYRLAMPVSAALAEIARCSGTQFDPHVVAAFLRLHGSSAGQVAPELQTQLG
jgi:HD-GYP domain-containing protein (c-di-GMP phosphodiesterase class II)